MNEAIDKSPDAYRTISEVAESIDLPQHVLRFWETRFPQIKPLKRGGGRRYYRPDDVELLRAIKRLLYDQGYTIKGVQKMLREQGAAAVIEAEGAAPAEPEPAPQQAPEPFRHDPPMNASAFQTGLGAKDIAALRAALADVREAERQLRQARAH